MFLIVAFESAIAVTTPLMFPEISVMSDASHGNVSACAYGNPHICLGKRRRIIDSVTTMATTLPSACSFFTWSDFSWEALPQGPCLCPPVVLWPLRCACCLP